MPDISRRSVLGGLTSALASSGLGGCGLFIRPIPDYCPTGPEITDPRLPLTIDTHAHVFNGTDLPVKAFFQRVLVPNLPILSPVGDLLQKLAWDSAPTGDTEVNRLGRFSIDLLRCKDKPLTAALDDDRQERYEDGVAQLKIAVARNPSLLKSNDRAATQLRDVIDTLPESYESYRSDQYRNFRALGVDERITGAVDFILRNFQYRYVNVFDYLFDYSTGKKRKIDLIVPHLVDYDWPIAGGKPTLTSFRDQIRVMEKISILTSGRVHCFVPFDPMKQVAFELGLRADHPMDFVRDAVERHGFIGVKLYPPMGFAPYGNARLDPDLWNQRWIPTELRRPDLGHRLDEALKPLYAWCLREDVPLMAHTSESNGPSPAFERLTDPKYWEEGFGLPPGLHASFGHFGASLLVENDSKRASAYAGLMTGERGSHGQYFYADSGYFVESLDRRTALKDALRVLYRDTADKGPAALAQRLMYGTDWEMIVQLGRDTKDYLERFQEIFAELDHEPSLGAAGRLSDRFFGLNAAAFLGLQPRRGNRERLDAFYEKHNVTKPVWRKKVDNPKVAAALAAR